MEIFIVDWHCNGQLLKGTKYNQYQAISGDLDKAFEIAKELMQYSPDFNVMIHRHLPRNTGTRKNPNMTEESIMVAVDTFSFQPKVI